MALTPLRATDPPSFGPYKLQGRLGAGGMGVVYLAFGPDGVSEASAVALKVLQPVLAQDDEYRQRFIREVTAARLIDSPHVARVVAAETDAEPLWMATEYVEGATLEHAVQTNGPIPTDRLRGLAADLAAAVTALHVAGLVHRDMKPQNVVLAWSGPKLIDFGIAKHEGATELTQAGMAVGSPLWMSPEVLAGSEAARASDIFGWGMCVAFAGTGRAPFGGGHPNSVAVRIATNEPDLAGLSPGMTDLVAAALSKDPAARPTAGQLGEALGSGGLAARAVAVPRADGGWTGPRGASTKLAVPPSGPVEPVFLPTGSEQPNRRRLGVVLGALAAILIAAGIVIGIVATRDAGKGSAGGSLTPLIPASKSATPTRTPSVAASSTSPPTKPPTTPPTSTPPRTPPPTSAAPVVALFAQAEDVVSSDGYTPYADSSSNWDPTAPINVILATKSGSADGYNNWAYFFAGNTYIGHDAKDPSIQISVFGRTQNTITLSYQLFAPSDPLCCPTANSQNVTYQYLNGVFTALDPIPGTDPNSDHR